MPDKILQNKFFAPAVILSVTLIVFLKTINFEFVWDDYSLLIKHPYINSEFNRLFDAFNPKAVYSGVYTPLTSTLYFLLFKAFGASSVAFHTTNLILYIAGSLLFYKLMLMITHSREKALVSSILFTLHTLHAEAVSWICAGSYLLATSFFLSAYISYLKSFENKKFLILAYLSFTVAALSQPFAVTFPALMLVHIFFFQREKLNQAIWTAWPMFFISLLSVVLNIIMLSETRFKNVTEIGALKVAVIAVNNLINTLIPHKFMPLYPLIKTYTPTQLDLIITLLILTIAITIFIKTKYTVYKFFLVWFIISILPYTRLKTGFGVLTADRYMFAATIASSFLWGSLIIDSAQKIKEQYQSFYRVFIITIATGLFLLGFQTSSYVECWRNDLSLWQYGYTKSPLNPQTAFNLGAAYGCRNMPKEALYYYLESLRLDPDYKISNHFAGLSLQELGEYGKSIPYLLEAEKFYPNDALISLLIAKAATVEKNYPLAFKSSEAALRKAKKPKIRNDALRASALSAYFAGKLSAFVHYMSILHTNSPTLPEKMKKALKLHSSGKYKESINLYKQIFLKERPLMMQKQLLLNAALLQAEYGSKSGEIAARATLDKDMAEKHLANRNITTAEKILINITKYDPYYIEVYQSLSDIYLKTDRKNEALKCLNKALRIDPSDKNTEKLIDSAKN